MARVVISRASIQISYIQLVDTDMLTAHGTGWTGFVPTLWGYCKCYCTSPRPS